jgi:hypothetical protein
LRARSEAARMRPESGLPASEKRGGGGDPSMSRQTPARPIPTRVGVRRPGSAALPPALAPKRVEFRWKLVWDESVEALIPASRPEPVVRAAPLESGAASVPRFAVLERPHAPEPESAPRSKLTRLDLAVEHVEETPAAETTAETLDLPGPSGDGRPWLKWVAGVMVVLGLAGAYMHFATGSSDHAAKQTESRGRRVSGSSVSIGAPIPMAPSGWRSMPAEDAVGMSAERRFSLYRTVAPMTDYVVEFNGHVLSKSLGWVVRVSDSRNYYGLRLELAKSGPASEVELVRFAVVDGEQGAAKRIPVPVAVHNQTMKVRVDVVGPRITTYVEGSAVDYWNDTRLHAGTFGFMNDKEGRAEIRSVRVSSPGTEAGR